ncbi:hypothetical protein SAMN05421821_10670 [Mucilaginibacter lappiensis]|nr:hypothetical protein SAMN05421821_10670 [Mucilaginibacter lappiensis]
MLEGQGVFDFFALTHFYTQSKGAGKLDFSLSVIPTEFAQYGASESPQNPLTPSPVLFLPAGDKYVHNHMNFGNSLWGAAGASEGLSLPVLQWGANYNSLHNSWTNGYDPQPDSADDQLLIARGVQYAQQHRWNWGKSMWR